MVDSGTLITAILTLVGGVVGFVAGALLTDWLAKQREARENKRKVSGLRKLLHGDILRMSHNLSSLQYQVTGDLNDVKVKWDDAETANRLLDIYRGYLRQVLRDEWHKSARAEPSIFSQLPPGEQAAFEDLYEFQLTILAISDKFIKGPELLDRIKAQEKELELILHLVQSTIRDKLNEELMLEMSTEQDRWYVTWIFHKEEVMCGLPEDATSEQIAERAKSVTKELHPDKEEKKPAK